MMIVVVIADASKERLCQTAEASAYWLNTGKRGLASNMYNVCVSYHLIYVTCILSYNSIHTHTHHTIHLKTYNPSWLKHFEVCKDL